MGSTHKRKAFSKRKTLALVLEVSLLTEKRELLCYGARGRERKESSFPALCPFHGFSRKGAWQDSERTESSCPGSKFEKTSRGCCHLASVFPCGKQEKAEWNEEEECALRKEKEDIAIRMTAWELAPRQHETTSHGQGCTLEAFQKCSDEDRSHAEAREDSRGSVAFPSKYPY